MKLSYLDNKSQHVDKNLGARILNFSNVLSDLHPNLAKFILGMPTTHYYLTQLKNKKPLIWACINETLNPMHMIQ